MSILQQFINAGWHTVPLGGQLIRDASGKKNSPDFEADWKNKYTREFNTRAVPLGGALTGALSGIVAIDCDTWQTLNIFRKADPNNYFIFPSLHKPEGGGTIIYRYNNLIPTFKVASSHGWALDYFSDGGFIYLPTEDNYTKEQWLYHELPPLMDMPEDVLSLLSSLNLRKTATEPVRTPTSSVETPALAPILMDFMAKQLTAEKYSPQLFKIITPHAFRSLELYQKQKHLHPDDIPFGRGSEYLMSISAILGKDSSVSVELYLDCMNAINNLFSEPMEGERFKREILNRMVNGIANIDGVVVWQYDKHWSKTGMVMLDKDGNYLEAFYDNREGNHYLIDHTTPYVKSFKRKGDLVRDLRSLSGRPLTEAHFDASTRLVRVVNDPSKSFGTNEKGEFNLFRQTQELDILNYPEGYRENYSRPDTTLKYFETLIPDPVMRAYVLSFMRTKLTTFQYSPVILYFIGVMGSGKDEFVHFFRRVLGERYVGKPQPSVFLDKFNGDLQPLIILQLDEYGDRIKKLNDREEASGMIKTITGSPDLQIRRMHTDAYNCKHGITIVMTSNKSPLIIDVDDRRIAYVRTPNILRNADWVQKSQSMQSVIDAVRAETKDFCYYLATEIDNLNPDEYQRPPDTADKEELIMTGLTESALIAYLITAGKFEELQKLGEKDYEVANFTFGWKRGRLVVQKLKELYRKMTEGKQPDKALTTALKNAGLTIEYTTITGMGQVSYYYSEKLFAYKVKNLCPFEPQAQEAETWD